MPNDVVVVIGAGGIGAAIARRQGFGKTVLLADFNDKVLLAAAEDLRMASYKVETQTVDVSSRRSVEALVAKAASLGDVLQVVNTAGLSPTWRRLSASWPSTCTARPLCSRPSAM
jgi:NAD(P)-dependent dehydrogenase (short-subunit alcohol dehydrogenase family)